VPKRDYYDDPAAPRANSIGESVAQAAVREVREEIGTGIEITGLSGVYSGPQGQRGRGSGGGEDFEPVAGRRLLGGGDDP